MQIDIPTLLLVVILAPFIGSFLCVLILRLPEGKPIAFDRSHCPACEGPLSPIDLVPIVSWLWLRGRCRHCGAAISPLYPAIEITAIFIAFWSATVTSGSILIASCILGWALLALSVIDWRTYLLPDVLTVFVLISGLGTTVLLMSVDIGAHLVGAVLGFGSLWTVGKAYSLYRGREGLGLGDAKLLAGIGAWVSWTGLPSVVLFAASFGLLFALLRVIVSNPAPANQRLPFGPFLAAGGWIVWLYGPISLSL